MLTNPSTLGVFERRIREIASIVHQAGGLLYYDGANLNAILGKVRPGDMGFDVIHMNLHKTFSTPHGGGGPGSGAVGVSERLLPFLPVPIVGKVNKEDRVLTLKDPAIAGQAEAFRWLDEKDLPQSIGRLSGFMGNAGILLRAYIYMRMLGRQGMPRVADYATLNANYLMARLTRQGFDAAFPKRRATHEFILTLKRQAKTLGVNTMAFAKRLLDKGFHAPTTYFPLLVPECLLIEPTETESKQELDRFVDAMCEVLREAEASPELVTSAPHSLPVRRLDDVRAAKDLDLTWSAAG
jgi:glycine dehydrogenase subunit 2